MKTESMKKLLIANRGEIARRIIRTCRKMGIFTVAVYSEADAQAAFVEEADESVCIGPAPAVKSYLNIDNIIAAARQTGAEAIHPGYGFLSENYRFAATCEAENLVFIGPSSEVIKTMGDKLMARRLMEAAGVPVVPGRSEKIGDLQQARSAAEALGFPVMLKASSGGGGVGIAKVDNDDALSKALSETVAKSQALFGDGTVFIEKFIENPRHVEVQIVADNKENIVHLYERECSVQRRNQKVIEESPSAGMTDAARERLLRMALEGIRHIGYTGVGTLEFLLDHDENFYFLEMNTRLQVEHPVTEMITGIDLVEMQIRIADGEPLPLKQQDIRLQGHALECRLYAEDPETFLPQPGKIAKLQLPSRDTRLDFAVREGDVITPYYDPMIGKIITHDTDRNRNLSKMLRVLEAVNVQGIRTNLPLLEKILRDPSFAAGQYDTTLVPKMTANTMDAHREGLTC
jgi:acetyl-CoA carboxylase biotin carboxylase subunit